VEAGEAPSPALKTGRKKLIILAAAALLGMAVIGGTATVIIKKRAAAAAEADEDGSPAAHAPARDVHKNPPVFLPLDPFIVNLADHDVERFAQIGITLELDDPHHVDELKAYMPAIRNGILLVLAHKTSQQLLGRAGKEALAAEIMREAVRPLGIEVDEVAAAAAAAANDDEEDDEDAAAKKKPKAVSADQNPIRHVHFSSFIIQ
ncbi:MAG TPA: flagellar basal body-associated FliL family protein, partial [Albitalea sp.]|nr:flagellar basal body-associated FliL family protein [Albitalea sp.]